MPKILSKSALALLLVLLMALLPSCRAPQQDVQVLPALKQAALPGRLVLIQSRQNGSRVMELDLASGAVRALFTAPQKSWLAAAEVSPDGKTLLLAYAPPPPNGEEQLNHTDLYTLPVGGLGAPQPLILRATPGESFDYPAWSPDGQAVIYAHSAPSKTARLGIETSIERLPINAPAGGQPQVILRSATWPRFSPDGAHLAYLGLSEFTSENSLHLVNADGSAPAQLVPVSQFPIVDAHIFSPDGREIYFTAPQEGHGSLPGAPALASPPPAADLPARLARLFSGATLFFGARPVTAHGDPSDWYRVSASGGEVRRVIETQDVNMAGAFSPDGQWLAYASQQGLFVMKPDGSQWVQIASLVGMGSLNWLE